MSDNQQDFNPETGDEEFYKNIGLEMDNDKSTVSPSGLGIVTDVLFRRYRYSTLKPIFIRGLFNTYAFR
ncbi:MAG: hypothetical protein Q9M91_05830 [Candidatus Dojkabacteria bacterium]|nr:hypothetical protein [Candidatus Dojkabacteria bacterium]MDQ7021319.1 hypothetical protein [Candidatus Dojkabacteria bacterium]